MPDAPFSAVRGCGAGLARGTEGLWRVRGSGLHGALLGLLQEMLGCRLKRKRRCRWYLLLEVFPGRGEEAKTQAVGAGQRSNLGRKTESFQKSPEVSTIPPGLQPGVGKRVVAGVAPGPSLQPVGSLLIFRSLGWEGWRRLRNNQPGSQPVFT